MKIFKILVLVLILGACSVSQQHLTCDIESAKKIAERQFTKKGIDAKRFECTVRDSAGYFLLSYLDSDIYRTGGGGEFVIDKSSCKIIKANFYQ